MREPARKATLKVVTMPNEPELVADDCDGTYTCDCSGCKAKKAELVKIGVRRSRPINVRPDRRAA